MRAIAMRAWWHGVIMLLGAALLIGPGILVARAAAPDGACCLANGQCLTQTEIGCDALRGEFIGPDTSCVMIECPTARVNVPLLSIFGVVAAVGALAGLGVYRLVVRRPAG